jgi:hypothetical protein
VNAPEREQEPYVLAPQLWEQNPTVRSFTMYPRRHGSHTPSSPPKKPTPTRVRAMETIPWHSILGHISQVQVDEKRASHHLEKAIALR